MISPIKKFSFILFISCLSIITTRTQSLSHLHVLLVIAHPDDESGCAATVYKITHDLHGNVDIALITNGEGGFKYSTLAEPYYNLELTKEEIGRENLPTIRKHELMSAGKIIGISKYFFFDQKDNKYTLDVHEALTTIWDTAWVKKRLTKIILEGEYNYIFVLLPTPETHGHHKGATILALETVKQFPENMRPTILALTVSNKKDSVQQKFSELEGFSITHINTDAPRFIFDRTQSFGYKDRLNYKIIVNWEIAEHKSQGTMQLYTNEGDYENFWFFDINNEKRIGATTQLFDQLKINHSKKFEYQE